MIILAARITLGLDPSGKTNVRCAE